MFVQPYGNLTHNVRNDGPLCIFIIFEIQVIDKIFQLNLLHELGKRDCYNKEYFPLFTMV